MFWACIFSLISLPLSFYYQSWETCLIPIGSFFALADIVVWLLTEIKTPYETLSGARALRSKFQTEGVSVLIRILSVFFIGLKPLSVIPNLFLKRRWKCQQIVRNFTLLMIIPVILHYLVRVFFYLRQDNNYCEAFQKQLELDLTDLNFGCNSSDNMECVLEAMCKGFYMKTSYEYFDTRGCWNGINTRTVLYC